MKISKMSLKNFTKSYSSQNFNEKGITLIALVITIIVLLILAGVSIVTLTGDNGLLTKVQDAKEENEKASDRDLIALAVSEAQIGNSGYQELNVNNLQEAIDNNFSDRNIVVFDNGDRTYTIRCLDTLKDYIITSNGIENGIDWNEVMADAVAPESQDELRNEGVIGIGTNGKTVDMDLWEYNFDNTTKGWGLNDSASLATAASVDASKGYSGTDFDNIVIPQYISIDKGDSWKPVTNLDWLFYNCTELEKIDKLPDTVKSMRYTFRGCENLSEVIRLPISLENMEGTFMSCTSLKVAPSIPRNVINMASTFSQCTSLKEVSKIPSNVTNLYYTFNQCRALVIAPEIPDNVTNMQLTFYNCISLEKGPSAIPNSVTNFYDTFSGCSNLKGIMEIDASITGKNIKDDKKDYSYCFNGASTENGTLLVLRCTENVYDLFYDEFSSNKIKSDVCTSESNIQLEKK